MTAAAFDRWAEAYDSGPEVAVVEPHLPREGRVVEVGAGTGRLTRRLAPGAGAYLAVDADPAVLARAAATAPATPVVADGGRLPLPAASAALVVDGWACSAVGPARALDEYLRVCRPDGRVVLFTEAWGETDRPDSDYVRVLREAPGTVERPPLGPSLWAPVRAAVPPARSLTERPVESAYRFPSVAAAVDCLAYHVASYNDGDADRAALARLVERHGTERADGVVLSEHARAFVVGPA